MSTEERRQKLALVQFTAELMGLPLVFTTFHVQLDVQVPSSVDALKLCLNLDAYIPIY